MKRSRTRSRLLIGSAITLVLLAGAGTLAYRHLYPDLDAAVTGTIDILDAQGKVVGAYHAPSAEEIAGLGNAYADEILWEARVKPRRTASLMTPDELARVHAATGVTLAAATEALRERLAGKPLRGEPKRDFLRVHHRARKPCPRCRTPIRMETLRDRSTYWCPTCQP